MKRESDALLRPCVAEAGAIEVAMAQPEDEAAWERFVASCPEATFFHRYGWKRLLERVLGHRAHFLLARTGREVVGVLPLAHVRSRMFGHSLSSLPFCVYGGAAVVAEPARARLHAAAVDLAQRLQVDHLELRNLQPCEPGWPRQDLYVTFRKALAADVEANMLAIPRKQRAMVRKGLKSGLRSAFEDRLDNFYDLYADNVHRHGTPPLSRRWFEALCSEFGDACRVLTVFAPDGAAVSSVLSFRFRDEILPYYAGDHASARELAANDFKYWELMRTSCEAGCRVFDYGRSKRGSGSFDFKKNWGFVPQPLHYEYRLVRAGGIPQNNPANARYRLFIAAWRRLPRPLANFIGPHIVRTLG
jgi:FemAB-related protein (PEP-CTERM system-associated)